MSSETHSYENMPDNITFIKEILEERLHQVMKMVDFWCIAVDTDKHKTTI